MVFYLYSRRAAYAALFLLVLSSCSSCPKWYSASICPPCPAFHSNIVIYTPPCRSSGIGFERLQTCSGIRYYVNVYSCPLENDIASVEASGIDGAVEGKVLCGGQRIWLPYAFGQAIMDRLYCGNEVTLTVERYRETLEPLDL